MNEQLKMYQFYELNSEEINTLWQDHLSYGEWGSGEDKITITDEMFKDFIEELYFLEMDRLKEMNKKLLGVKWT